MPENDGESGGGSDGGGESGGGGGENTTCTLWEVIGYESADGGVTWEEIYRYYYYECP